MTQQVRIGGGSAGLGDGVVAIPQLLRGGELDYLMLDYLSEYFMPQAGRSRQRDPQTGYVPGFPDEIVAVAGRDLAGKKVKIVTNAGAVNPRACAAAIRDAARRSGLDFKIAVVDGDDVIERAAEFRKSGRLNSELPEGRSYTTLNAYLGAFPIARALALGADLVITGRVVDSALCLGPLIHEFGWRPEQYDLLSAGSLIGHILECGAQASGGIFTDWREVGDYTDVGYPIAECRADGSAVITKAPRTGGLVSVGTVAEQLVYEIADPRSYHLPDVVCDFSNVRFEQLGPNRVLMTGAKGRPPGPNYKVNATWDDGWFASWGYAVRGQDAADRAKAIAAAVLRRGARLLRERNLPALRRSRVEIIGDEESWGAHGRSKGSREIFCRITIEAGDDKTFGILLRETGTGSVSMAPGIVGSMMMFNPGPHGAPRILPDPGGRGAGAHQHRRPHRNPGTRRQPAADRGTASGAAAFSGPRHRYARCRCAGSPGRAAATRPMSAISASSRASRNICPISPPRWTSRRWRGNTPSFWAMAARSSATISRAAMR